MSRCPYKILERREMTMLFDDLIFEEKTDFLW